MEHKHCDWSSNEEDEVLNKEQFVKFNKNAFVNVGVELEMEVFGNADKNVHYVKDDCQIKL